MALGKFEVKILKEVDGSDVSLENLSIEASRALVDILEAMTNIAASQNENDTLSVSIRPGSACVAIEGDYQYVEKISNTLEVVADNQSEDPIIVDYFRNIQSTIKRNGLEYGASFISDDDEVDVINIFKESKKFTKKRKKTIRKHNFHVEFFEGRLIEIGGKNPNIHIEEGNIKYTIDCTELEARRIRDLLYADVLISAWAKPNANGKIKYTFCDHYVNRELYIDFKDFIKQNIKEIGTAPLKGIHYKLADFLKDDDLGKAKKFIKFFNSELTDISRLRTILLNTKAFKNEEQFMDVTESIIELIERKTKKKLI